MNIFGSPITKAVDSITHEPYLIKVAEKEIEVPRPCLRQMLLAEKYFSSINELPDDAGLMDKVTHLKEAEKLARVASIFLSGKDDSSLAKNILDRWTVTDIVLFVTEVLVRDGEVEDFFAFTASLKKRKTMLTEADDPHGL